MTNKPKSRQGLVDSIFRGCMNEDLRTRSQIRYIISAEVSDLNGDTSGTWDVWFPSTYDLHVMISRVASRERKEGGWAYYPAYGNPKRYISMARIDQLCAKADRGLLSPEEHAQLKAMQEDLVNAIGHWQGQHRVAQERVQQLTHALVRTEVTTLELGGQAEMDLAESVPTP